jgi:spore coat polysaccharide biosynthesis protein SpsF
VKISATIQARTGSKRLPNKVLQTILGKPMLAHQVERIQRSSLIDEVIIATSTNPADDKIEELAHVLGVKCFRGSEERVLDRVVGALKHFNVDLHVCFWGDCPLPDWTIIDTMIGMYLKHEGSYDYLDTGLRTTFPPGLEVHVYPAKILYDVERLVTRPEDREHATVHLRLNKDRYRILNVEAPDRYRYPDLHLEVDTIEDFRLVTAVYEALYPSNPSFLLSDIIRFMKQNPELADSNRHVHRRWKEFRKEDVRK